MTTNGLPITTPEICELPARRLAKLIAQRKLSSREVVTAFLMQIEDLNPSFNAIVAMRDRAAILADTDAADAAVARGDDLDKLHGLPMAVKDTADTAGIITTYGSPLFARHIPDADGLMVARLRAAGAIFIGKTNVPEFGLGSHTFNPIYGATGNAYNPAFCAGGSSGGAAAAVALRMLPLADGSDFGGSLRNPAAYNNVLGFRPSQGRVPRWPRQDAYLDQMVTEGPIARSADDLLLLLSVQSGYDSRAPLSLDSRLEDCPGILDVPLAGRKIAWLGDLGGHLPFEPGILPLCQAALESFAPAGISLQAITQNFGWEKLWQAFVILRQFGIGSAFAPAYADKSKRVLMKPELKWEIEYSTSLTTDDLAQALATRTAFYDFMLGLFKNFDYLALPAAQVFPFPINQRWPAMIAGREMDSYHRWMEVVVPGTMCGCPVISLPAGFSNFGLPMGVQIIGRPRDDLSVLQLANLQEQISPQPRIPPAIATKKP
jgi:amidase